MVNPDIVFYDENVEYISRLNKYLSDKYSNYNIFYFTSEENFKDFCQTFEGIGVFIIAERCMSEVLKKYIGSYIILLVEEENIAFVNNYSALYRYQSADRLISVILNYCADNMNVNTDKKYVIKNDCKIIGIYSPINRCGKTNLSIELAKSLGKDVLLVNLEEFSDIMKTLEINSDYSVSDLMYFFLKGADNFAIKLDAVVKEYCNFYLIPPIDNPEDLYDIEADMWVRFILNIADIGKYKYVILDISNVIKYFTRIFEICAFVFIPYIEDVRSINKLNKFDIYINNRFDNFIKNKIFKISMNKKPVIDIVHDMHIIMEE